MSNLDNSNDLGFATYDTRTDNDGGSQLTKRNFARKFSDVANKYRDLLITEQPYQEFFY